MKNIFRKFDGSNIDVNLFDFSDYKFSNSEMSNITPDFYQKGVTHKLKQLDTNIDDLAKDNSSEGELWYNTTDKNVYLRKIILDPDFSPGFIWEVAPGTPLQYSRDRGCATGGDGYDKIIVRGRDAGGGIGITGHQRYDGLTFSALADSLTTLSPSRAAGSASNARVVVSEGTFDSNINVRLSGSPGNEVWSTIGNIIELRYDISFCGDGTDAGSDDNMTVGGRTFVSGQPVYKLQNIIWDGISESFGTSILSGSFNGCIAIGNTLNALLTGETEDGAYTNQEYDGTSWSAAPNTLQSKIRQHHGFGKSNYAFIAGGKPSDQSVYYNKTTFYNGTSWSYENNLLGDIYFANFSSSAGNSLNDSTNDFGLIIGAITSFDNPDGVVIYYADKLDYTTTPPPKAFSSQILYASGENSTIDSTLDSTVSSTIDSTIDSTLDSTI